MSSILSLGAEAPAFSLLTADGNTVTLGDFAGATGYLVTFLCNHCPYVKHVEKELGVLTAEYADRGVAVVGIMPNDVGTYPDDGPDGMRDQAERAGWTFPYVVDDRQDVAKAYGAVCTPDFFVFDADRKLVYRGQMDDARPRSGEPVTGKDLRAALDAVLEGKPVPAEQKPPMGCSIKWGPGNAPS